MLNYRLVTSILLPGQCTKIDTNNFQKYYLRYGLKDCICNLFTPINI